MSTARYDGHADWYDDWARTEGAGAMAAAHQALEELVPPGEGPAVDVGCGTGLHAEPIRGRGYAVMGVDLSADQLRLAAPRLSVVRASATALPFADRSMTLAVSVLTHTDVDDFAGLVRECVRVLRPEGCFVHVGVHPCFVSPVAERLRDGVRLHPGYRQVGWHAPTPYTGTAVRSRVGVHHLTLESLLSAVLHPEAPIEAVVEHGGSVVPELLGFRLRRRR